MRIFTVLPQLHRLIGVFFHDFLPWYFIGQPIAILKLYAEYAKTFSAIFSIPFLLKTLVSPWKSIADRYPDNLLQFGKVLQVFTLNCTARCVGFVVRTATIVIAMVIQLVLLTAFFSYVVIWLTFPLLAILGLYILVLLSAG